MGGKGGKEKKKGKGVLKVLMLGISGSGKSTFAKQMKIIHMEGFSENEIELYKTVMRVNVLIGMKELTKQTTKIDQHVSEKNRRKARFFNEANHYNFETMEWSSDLVKKLVALWDDPAIKLVWQDASLHQYQIINMDYMMQHLDRISSPDFIPNNQDILLARQRTTGFTTIEFMKDKYKWELIDVGGQIPERAKWDTVMGEGATAVIYFAGLDEYNMTSADDRTKSKMQISLEVFKTVINSDLLENSTLFLFLNKVDLLEKKLTDPHHYHQLKTNFPQYTGTQNLTEVTQFFRSQFLDLAPGKEIHPHIICAIDTDMMNRVFEVIKQNIFAQRMDNFFNA